LDRERSNLVAKEPSSTPNPEDEPKAETPESSGQDGADAELEQTTIIPELIQAQPDDPSGPKRQEPDAPGQLHPAISLGQPLGGTGPEPPSAVPPREISSPPLPKVNYSGVLVENEIRDQNLIRVPDADYDDPRCYQPASYDLRLGAEYVTPHKDRQLQISRCDTNGMLTIGAFGMVIVSTYESVATPNNVVGRFNLRIAHAFEGIIVQMGTQVEPNYEGPLFALLHNISDQPKSLKFRDYDTRPFTIEFSYTSQPSRRPDERKTKKKSFSEFIPPNHARGGLDMVLNNIHTVQDEIKVLSEEFNAKKMLWFTGGALLLIVATATIFIPLTLAKFTYDKNYFPIVNTEAIAAMKYGPNHSNNAEIAKQVLRELETKPPVLPSRENFYAERLTQLKARRDSLKKDSSNSAELKSIQKEIDEIIELLKK
jgi:deoxycytidine triphosphate deaminase